MHGRTRKTLLAAALGLVALFAVAPAAQASFHDIRIRAVFKGPMDASFVMLQMTSPGQGVTNGQRIVIYGATGNLVDNSTVLPDTIGEDQRTILIGDTVTAGNPDVTKATLYDLLNGLAAGAVCYESFDCFSWGGAGFTGDAMLPTTAGTPASGLSTNQVLVRNISANCPTALDNADDTNNSAADFAFTIGFPPRNNAQPPLDTPCPPPTPAPTLISTPPLTVAPAVKKCKKGRKLKKGKCVRKKKKK